jgi:proliferating cell nuclear antigen PCNA
MDKSHVCLCEITISNTWFNTYSYSVVNEKSMYTVTVDSNQFALLLNYGSKHDIIELIYDQTVNDDKLHIHFLKNKTQIIDKVKEKNLSFDHFFELVLVDVDQDQLGIPTVDYDAEICMDTKKFVELLVELNSIGTDLFFHCRENIVELQSSSEYTKLMISIDVNELHEYSITEEENIEVSFSLSHLTRMCASVKLSPTIFVGISKEYPMLLKYDLGDNSHASFYAAPKIID